MQNPPKQFASRNLQSHFPLRLNESIDKAWVRLYTTGDVGFADKQDAVAMNSIELFAGAGGLALGVARAGFEHEVVLEWDRNACDTLRRNQINGVEHVTAWKIEEGDVRRYDFSHHCGTVDFIAGGPPCQPFSLGGRHQGRNDQRNMFPQAVRAIREIRPVAFIFENVKGLLRRNFADYYSYIIHQFCLPELTSHADEHWLDHLRRLRKAHANKRHEKLRYNVEFKLLNAADYGVPQIRERVFIVGIRADLGTRFSFPPTTHSEDALLFTKWISREYWDRHRVERRGRPEIPESKRARIERLRSFMPDLLGQPWRTVRDAIGDLPRISIGQRSSLIANHFLNPGARSYPGHTGSALDEPAKTLKAGDHGVPGGENTLRLNGEGVRYLSVRECARLQTFPDDWIFEGSWTESMRQLGNAVPVLLAETVATRLLDLLAANASADEVESVPRFAQ